MYGLKAGKGSQTPLLRTRKNSCELPKTGDVTPKNVYEPPEIGCRVGGLPRPIRHQPLPKKSSARERASVRYAECVDYRRCRVRRPSPHAAAALRGVPRHGL